MPPVTAASREGSGPSGDFSPQNPIAASSRAKRQRPEDGEDENGRATWRDIVHASTDKFHQVDEEGDEEASLSDRSRAGGDVENAALEENIPAADVVSPAAEAWPPIVIIVDIHGHTFTLYLPHERSSEAVRHAEEWGDTHGTVDWLLAQVDSKLTACCGLVTVPGSATLHVHPALTSGDLPSPDVALARDLSLRSLDATQLQFVVKAPVQFPQGALEAYSSLCRRSGQLPCAAVYSQIKAAATNKTDSAANGLEANFSVLDLHGEGLDMCCSFLGSWAFELRGLSLAHLPISDLSHFAANVPNAACLQWLDLSHQRLTAGSLRPLLDAGERAALPSLQSLRLNHNPLGDALPDWSGVPAEVGGFAQIARHLPSARGQWKLRSLELVDTHVGDVGCGALTEAFRDDCVRNDEGSAAAPVALITLDLRGNPHISQSMTASLACAWRDLGKPEAGLLLGDLW